MVRKILSEKSLLWKTKDKKLEIKTLKELLDVLIDIKQENIDSEIKENLGNLINWLEENFPKQMELIAHLKTEGKEFTPQQIREMIARDLRKII